MTKPVNDVSRRDFLRRSTLGAAAVGALQVSAAARVLGANERLRVGFVGVGSSRARCQAHIGTILKMQREGRNIEAAAICDVFNRYRDETACKIKSMGGVAPQVSGDYRDLLANRDLDVIVVATPDHWHARMTIEALEAGKAVYCERPMTHTIAESQEVLQAWKRTGGIVQVGVQSTSDGRWRAAHEFIRTGGIGKVLQAQTSYYRNSGMGQWRYYGLSHDMTPRNIDWPMFLGTQFGLADDMPFDRAKFGQWRCYWPFGHGLYSDLFVQQLTRMLVAAGVRYPRRVVSSGGIFLEYDGRDVPDTATLVADYEEGLQILITSTMCCDYPIEHCIRGHYGTLTFDSGNNKDGFDFIPERPQVTRQRDSQRKHTSAFKPVDETYAHWENFLEAIELRDPLHCHNPPDLGAAAVATVLLGAESYRTGRVMEWDNEQACIANSGEGYARQWEALSQGRSAPRQINGWSPANDNPQFSRQRPEDYQKLEGPWHDGRDPAV